VSPSVIALCLAGAFLGLTGALLGCAPSGAPPSAAAFAVTPVDLRAPGGQRDATTPPGPCPPDAPWNGRLCLGGGYVACPGDARFDDAGVCQRSPEEARDAGRVRRDE
jgi:hypothetical protein